MWDAHLRDADGRPRTGVAFAAIRFARAHHLLPEAYLFGFAFALAQRSVPASSKRRQRPR